MFKFPSLFRMASNQVDPRAQFLKGILPVLLTVSMVVSGVPAAHAATTPALGEASTYGILSSTYTNTVGGTTITGDVGFTTGPAVAPGGAHTNYGSGAPYATAGADQGSALAVLAAQPCTFTFAPGAINLSTDITHGPIGVYTPGVYCSSGAMNVGGPLTLNGNGTYIFRAVGALTSTVGATVTLAGASACDLFWTPTQATTLAANTTFAGTVIDNAGITIGANTTWVGRALAFGGTVTTDTNTITVPTCAGVVEDSEGGRALRRPIISVTKVPSPLALPDGPGSVTYTYEVSNPGVYTMHSVTLTDDKCSPVNYVSGDINDDALLQNTEVWTYDCTTSISEDTYNAATAIGYAPNNLSATDIAYASVRVGTQLPPPLIHVVKTPNLLLLPFGGGKVTYKYSVSNPGVVALHNVQVSDDKCSAESFISGDIDNDTQLDTNETWIYTCQSSMEVTTTNTVTVTGSANNETATDVAFATVVVAPPPVVVPPVEEFRPAAPLPPVVAPTPEVPLLPNTGVGPEATSISWTVVASGLLMATLSVVAALLQVKNFSSIRK